MTKLSEDARVTRVGGLPAADAASTSCLSCGTSCGGRCRSSAPGHRSNTRSRSTRPEAFRRFAVKPGITGLWQVRGRSLLTFDADDRPRHRVRGATVAAAQPQDPDSHPADGDPRQGRRIGEAQPLRRGLVLRLRKGFRPRWKFVGGPGVATAGALASEMCRVARPAGSGRAWPRAPKAPSRGRAIRPRTKSSARTRKPGNPASEWDVKGRAIPASRDSQPASASTAGKRSDSRSRPPRPPTGSTSTGWATTAGTAPARSPRSNPRPRFHRASPPAKKKKRPA